MSRPDVIGKALKGLRRDSMRAQRNPTTALRISIGMPEMDEDEPTENADAHLPEVRVGRPEFGDEVSKIEPPEPDEEMDALSPEEEDEEHRRSRRSVVSI